MKKRVELPLVEPLYSSYHYQGPGTSIIANNQSIRNWYLNQAVSLICGRRFINGYTSPEVSVKNSLWSANPHFEIHRFTSRFTKKFTNQIIKEFLDNNYYVTFSGVDDYYVQGKSWYKQRHFNHDGMICGYDEDKKTYSLYAYDENWMYKRFLTPQRNFNLGRISMEKEGVYTTFCAVKANNDIVVFSPKTACENIKEYLDSNMEKYSICGPGCVYGIVVHEYVAMYLDKLYDGSIPYERMDRRVFRLIWEHKKAMLERIEKIEQELNLGDEISKKYQLLVYEADTMRMLYASHHMKRRDSVLPIIRNKLLKLMDEEKNLLTLLLEKTEGRFENDAMGVC